MDVILDKNPVLFVLLLVLKTGYTFVIFSQNVHVLQCSANLDLNLLNIQKMLDMC